VFGPFTCIGSETDETPACRSWTKELRDRLQQISDVAVQSPKQPSSAVVAGGLERAPSSRSAEPPTLHIRHPNPSQLTEHSNVCKTKVLMLLC